MFNLNLAWKSFNVNLETAEAWVKTHSTGCTGSSGNTQWQLHFTEEPTQEIKDAIVTYWEGITEESSETTSYISRTELQVTIETIKTQLLTKNWNDMSIAERKLVIGQTPTREELGI